MSSAPLRLHHFENLKPGTLIKGRYGGQYAFITMSMPTVDEEGELTVFDAHEQTPWTVSESDIIADPTFSKIEKKKLLIGKHTFFNRGDYVFIVFEQHDQWQLIAGCRHLSSTTLEGLKEDALKYWSDSHGTDYEHAVSDQDAQARASQDSCTVNRVKLNQKTRRGIKKMFDELMPAKKAAPALARRRKAKKRTRR